MYICVNKRIQKIMKKHTNIRMDEKLHNWITKEAAKEGRSFTNYIERIMSQHKELATAKVKSTNR